jgi:drug/metabolite transporter (DMT)-like permease
MNDHFRGLILTIVGVLFVVPDSLFVRLIEADALTVAFWRSLLSGLAIGLIVLGRQGTGAFRALAHMGRHGPVYALFLGASGVLFVIAVSLTSVANVVFIIASMPVFAALFSRVFLGERISRRMVLTILVVGTGLAVIAYGSNGTGGASFAGDLVALCVAASFAAALTTARGLRHISMVPAIPLANLGAALFLWPFVNPFAVPSGQWGLVALHGGFFIAVSTVLLSLGPRYLPSAEVALLILLESVLAPLLVWAVLGENPGPWGLAGGALVVGALVVSNLIVLLRSGSAARRPPAS